MRMMLRKPHLLLTATLGFLFCTNNSTLAQGYPNRDIKVICGFAAGTGPDIATRYVANMLRKASGMTVVVENRPGALSAIAAQVVAKSKPDGYTIFVTSGNSTFSSNIHLLKDPGYDPLKDFTPVSTMWRGGFAFAVAPDSPHNTLQELTAGLKTMRPPIKFGYNNSIGLASAKLYAARIGIDPVGVSYRSTIDATSGLVQHEFEFMSTDISPLVASSRRIKPLAVTTKERQAAAPDFPSSKEGGLDDFDLWQWWGVWLPAGAPKDVVETIQKWVKQGMDDEFTKFINSLGSQPWPDLQGDALMEFMRADQKKWGEIIALAKIEKE